MPTESPISEFQSIVDERGTQLRSLTYMELKGMNREPIQNVTVQGRKGTIGLIIEELSDETLRVVIQGFLKCWQLLGVIGVSSVALDGFHISKDDIVSAMPDEKFGGYD